METTSSLVTVVSIATAASPGRYTDVPLAAA